MTSAGNHFQFLKCLMTYLRKYPISQELAQQFCLSMEKILLRREDKDKHERYKQYE